jgi:hypothetical protein
LPIYALDFSAFGVDLLWDRKKDETGMQLLFSEGMALGLSFAVEDNSLLRQIQCYGHMEVKTFLFKNLT